MKPIPGGVDHTSSANGKVNYPGKVHRGQKAKHTGVADGGMDLGKDATNCISGTKRTNKMLSPGPGIRKHA